MVSNRVSFVLIFNDSMNLMQNQKRSRVIFDMVYRLIIVLIRFNFTVTSSDAVA